MINVTDLRKIARARIRDAEALLAARRYDGGTYICGYAVELALKAKACRVLHWPGFPESKGEFHELLSFKTHNLDTLLRLSGQEQKVKTDFFTEWSAVSTWNSESRYHAVGTANRAELALMIASARTLLRAL